MKYGLIYKVTNIETKKVYIGKTTKNFKDYIRWHLQDAKNNVDKGTKYLYNSIRKYSPFKFKWEILGYCSSKEELN